MRVMGGDRKEEDVGRGGEGTGRWNVWIVHNTALTGSSL